MLVFTTPPDADARVEQVLEVYRLRWQVELTFKRLKSIAQIGHISKRDGQSSRAWLYGKRFAALLSQRLAQVGKSMKPCSAPLVFLTGPLGYETKSLEESNRLKQRICN